MTHETSNDTWTACREGQLGALAGELRAAQRRQTLTRRAVIGGSLATILMASVLLAKQFPIGTDEPLPAISCSELRRYTKQIIAGALNGPLGERIRIHLGHCKSCHDHVEARREDSAKRPEREGPGDDAVAMAGL